MVLKYLLVASLVTIAGCSTFWKGKSSSSSQGTAASGSTAPQPAPQPSQTSSSEPSKSSWMQSGTRTPGMASSRKINEQSCTTGGVDLTAGNLRCK